MEPTKLNSFKTFAVCWGFRRPLLSDRLRHCLYASFEIRKASRARAPATRVWRVYAIFVALTALGLRRWQLALARQGDHEERDIQARELTVGAKGSHAN